MIKDWKHATISIKTSIESVISNLNNSTLQIALIINDDDTLEGTITDGDIRRALLKGFSLKSPIGPLINKRPLVVPENLEKSLVLQLMALNRVHQIPAVDDRNRVVGLYVWEDFSAPKIKENTIVLMAGGEGKRLRPLTSSCPKPMLKVGGKPILEQIIQRAYAEGFINFVISINYLGHIIQDYFENGAKFGVNIEYICEESPLGTAGSLSLLKRQQLHPFIVANGDVLTDVKYSELLDFHERHEASATMAVRLFEFQNPFGVVQMNGINIVGFEEKPILSSHVNAGIYVFSPKALTFLSKNESCDAPELFKKIKENGLNILAYPMHEPWLDVGNPSDLERANKDFLIKTG
jgi:dTDP-glucose pyrophosphorylase